MTTVGFLTVKQAAEGLGVSVQRIYARIYSGRIRCARVADRGRDKILISTDDYVRLRDMLAA